MSSAFSIKVKLKFLIKNPDFKHWSRKQMRWEEGVGTQVEIVLRLARNTKN